MWSQIASAIVNVGLAWQDQYMSNRINKAQYRAAAKTAEIKAKMADANLGRRSGYRNEELGQAVWNMADNAKSMMGAQRTAMGASGFDISTGDQRILADTLRRDLAKQSGANRTAYLQQFEDDLQTRSDILQYNFEAWANRKMAKQYSGFAGYVKIVSAGIRAFVGSSGGPFSGNQEGGISSNTGANQMAYPSINSTNSQLQTYLNDSTNLSGSLGNYGNFAMKF